MVCNQIEDFFEQDPHTILCLQEVLPRQLTDIMNVLGREVYEAVYHKTRPGVNYEMVTIFRKDFSTSGSEYCSVYNRAGNFYSVGFDYLRVVNVHMPVDLEWRNLRLADLYEFIERQQGPVLFCGDFNAFPLEEGLRLKRSMAYRGLFDVTTHMEWEDGSRALHTFEPFPADSYQQINEYNLDHIFVSSGITCAAPTVYPVRKLLIDDMAWPASDHLAVRVECEIE